MRWLRRLAPLRHIIRLWLTLRHQILGRRYRRLVLESIDGVPLIVLPAVFNPVLFRSGQFLAEVLSDAALIDSRRHACAEVAVLDLGTGSGVGAVFAARLGARVVAVDVNPDAIRCARINALLNRLEDRIDVRLGDLFEPVAEERFDLVVFNPPFFRGQPRDDLDWAWRSPDVIERFASGLGDHLRATGRALLVLSTEGESRAALAALQASGFTARPLARRDFGIETLTAYLVEPESAESDQGIA